MPSKTEPSWCRITSGDSAEATFRFTIDNFKNRPEKFKESVKSTCFRMQGPGDLMTKWKLKIYPKGKVENHKDYVGLSLMNESQVKVKAEYKINIIDGDGKERTTYKSKAHEYENIGWGMRKWFKREKFNTRPYLLPDGNLTLQCTITVLGAPKVLSGVDLDSTNPNLSVDCQKQLGKQLGKAFSEKQFTDIKIQCEGQTFDCHKAVLAVRSPVFMAMFQSDMKEMETNTVTIEDFKPEVISELLTFTYTGNISSHDNNDIATDLLAAADKYQLDLLRNILEERLCSTLEVANCVEYLVLGEMYHAFKLKKLAMRLVVENVDSITDTDVVKDLFKQKPELALEVMKAVNKK